MLVNKKRVNLQAISEKGLYDLAEINNHTYECIKVLVKELLFKRYPYLEMLYLNERFSIFREYICAANYRTPSVSAPSSVSTPHRLVRPPSPRIA